MIKIKIKLFFVFLFAIFAYVFLAAAFAKADDNVPEKLTVGVYPFTPMVIEGKDGQFTGFDIDYMKALAHEVGVQVEFVKVDTFHHLITDVNQKKVDAAISGITVDYTRETEVDFSHPYMESGLSILTRTENVNDSILPSFLTWSFALKFLGAALLLTLGVLVMCVIFAYPLWLSEKGSEGIPDAHKPGIKDAVWYAYGLVTTTGHGDITARTWRGRLVSMFFGLSGMLGYSVLTASLGAMIVVEQIQDDVSTLNDLTRKSVAVVPDTKSAEAVHDIGARVVEATTFEQSVEMLRRKRVEYLVSDTTSVLYMSDKDENLSVTGSPFEPKPYAIALPENSPLRETFNRAILKLANDGTYKRIHGVWF